jgi:hypothetical protein
MSLQNTQLHSFYQPKEDEKKNTFIMANNAFLIITHRIKKKCKKKVELRENK